MSYDVALGTEVIYLCGNVQDAVNGLFDVFFASFTNALGLNYMYKFGSTDVDTLYDCALTPDNRYLIGVMSTQMTQGVGNID